MCVKRAFDGILFCYARVERTKRFGMANVVRQNFPLSSV